METCSQLTLNHDPCGDYHPYESLPCERSPRHPASDDPVILGVETGLAKPAESVWCVWRVNGQPAQTAYGVRCGAGEKSVHWQVTLPAFTGGETVHYRFYAAAGDDRAETEEFVFFVDRWITIQAAAVLEKSESGLSALCSTTQPGLKLRLDMDFQPDGTLDLRFIPAKGAAVPEAGEPILHKQGDLLVSLQGSPLEMEIRRLSDGLVLQSAGALQMRINADGMPTGYRFAFKSAADEAFYGFGERFNAFDQRGNRLLNHVYAQYLNQGKRSYIPIPFFISSRSYGFWLQTERQAVFDLAATWSDRWVVEGQAEENGGLELTFFFQPLYRNQVQAFTGRVGKPSLPPPWVFGLWISSNDWNSQAEVLHQLALSQKHQIPPSVLVIEAWSDEITFYLWNDSRCKQKPASKGYHLDEFIFPPEGRWPDPKAMVDEIHQAGVRLVLWQIPVLKRGNPAENLDETQKMADEEFAIRNKYLVSAKDGSPHRLETTMPWFPGSLLIDFTNPEAEAWWMSKRAYLLAEMGVDGFKTDGGEHIWHPDAFFHNGVTAASGINLYPQLYQSAYQQFLKSHRADDFVLFSRAGYTGIQKYSCHWAGDESSTWDAFRATLRAMLNVGLCGVSFIGWDIAGFAGAVPSSELYLRAAAFSVFCPIMQYHSDYNGRRSPNRDRTPWNVQEQTGDEDVIPIFRFFTNLRLNLIPYIVAQARLSSQSGLPLMRPLWLEFPQDVACRQNQYEYLFGEALLVAPVLEEGRRDWQVYLPGGEWRDLWTGDIYAGPCMQTIMVPPNRIPVFQRRGSILPLNLGDDLELGSPAGGSTETMHNLTALIFAGEFCQAEIYQGKDEPYANISACCLEPDGVVEIVVQGLSRPLDLLVAGVEPHFVSLDSNKLSERTDAPAYWRQDARQKAVRVHLPANEARRTVTLS